MLDRLRDVDDPEVTFVVAGGGIQVSVDTEDEGGKRVANRMLYSLKSAWTRRQRAKMTRRMTRIST